MQFGAYLIFFVAVIFIRRSMAIFFHLFLCFLRKLRTSIIYKKGNQHYFLFQGDFINKKRRISAHIIEAYVYVYFCNLCLLLTLL